MERIRRLLQTIGAQLGKLSPTHKLLIGSLVVVALMALFLVSQYAGSPKMIELLPGASADAISRARVYLETAQLPYKDVNGKLSVPAERHMSILAALGEAGKLPDDASVTFRNYIEKQNWMNPKSENDRIFNTALENTLALVIKNFRGIESATVVIDAPEQRGIGASFRKPTASVIVFTRGGAALGQSTVDAIAATVSSAKSGLDPRNVNVTDGTTGRRFAARNDDDLAASSYMEHMAKFEEYVQSKIANHLAYIRGVSIAVSAQVDVRKTTSHNRTVKPKGAGSETLLSKETSTTSSTSQPSSGGEPGIGANISLDINTAGGAGAASKDDNSETAFESSFGFKDDQVVDPRGMPTKINATIGVPRDYVAALWEQAQGQSAGGKSPSDADLQPIFDAEKTRLEKAIAPLIETDAPAGSPADQTFKAGSVVVSMIPVAGLGGVSVPGGGTGGGADGAGLLGGGTLALSGWVKQAVLGVLALLAMGMMVMMTRKAGKPAELPTAEEIVGVPPALANANDLVGEAEESETAMLGIEVDDDELKVKKMLDQVGDLVKSKPSEAAALFTRWVQPEG
ncbi:MAG: hypothetical protein AB7G11_05105 [Phycisphaerales bacterium]